MRNLRGAGSGRTRAQLLAVFLVLLVGALLTACGGGDGDGSTEEASAGGGEATTTEATTPSEGQSEDGGEGVTDYVAYTGGTAGPADQGQAPVKIGWVNNEGGSIAPVGPSSTAAAEFAVQYINENLGGVEGHPVELDKCFVRNAEEEGLGCAQQFLNDDGVKAVALGAVAVGADTINSTINGEKPIMLGVSFTPASSTAPNTFILFGASEFTVYPWGSFGRDVLNAETAAVIYPEGPGLAEVAEAITRGNEAAGIETKLVGYDPERSGDLVGALTAAGAQNAEMITPMVAGPDCVSADKGMSDLGIDPSIVVGSSLCLTPELLEGFGGDYPKWVYGVTNDALANDPPTPGGAKFVEILEEGGEGDNVFDPWWPVTFSQIFTTVKFLNAAAAEEGGVDSITSDAISKQAEQFDGPLLVGPPEIECGKYPESPASCNDSTRFAEYQGDGKYKAVGEWQQPPPELQEELGAK